MTNRIIYDRENLCQEIIDQIESSNETQGIILYSQIGIGKTSVCRKVESIMNKKTQRNVRLFHLLSDTARQKGRLGQEIS